MSGFVAQASAEIRAAEDAHQARKAEGQRLRRPIDVIDSLLAALEELNLKGVSRVPLAYEPRLLQLRAMVRDSVPTPEHLDGLRTRIRIVRLMDHLYSVQEALFARMLPDIPREPDGWDRVPAVLVDNLVQPPDLFSAA